MESQSHFDQHHSLTPSLIFSCFALNSFTLIKVFFLLPIKQLLMPIILALTVKVRLIFSSLLLVAFVLEIDTLMLQFVLRKTLCLHTDLSQGIQLILIKWVKETWTIKLFVLHLGKEELRFNKVFLCKWRRKCFI